MRCGWADFIFLMNSLARLFYCFLFSSPALNRRGELYLSFVFNCEIDVVDFPESFNCADITPFAEMQLAG